VLKRLPPLSARAKSRRQASHTGELMFLEQKILVLLFQFLQILSRGVMDLRRFPQLFPWNPPFFGSVLLHEAAIPRQMSPLHQSHFHTLFTICSNNCSNSFDS
jgi:hypothetical protein